MPASAPTENSGSLARMEVQPATGMYGTMVDTGLGYASPACLLVLPACHEHIDAASNRMQTSTSTQGWRFPSTLALTLLERPSPALCPTPQYLWGVAYTLYLHMRMHLCQYNISSSECNYIEYSPNACHDICHVTILTYLLQ